MSAYITRKNAVVTALAAEFDISPIFAGEVANLWEFAANRRGIDQRTDAFWDLGREFMVRQVAAARPTARPGP